MTLLYFVLLVGVLIFVHEFGHFLMAKLFNVKVLKFSLGFGPAALGFRRGETEYCIAWLPLGGFVKMLGEDPAEPLRREDHERAFHHKPLWQRYAIVLAGPVFNIIFPTLIYFIFFAAQSSLPPPVIGKVLPDEPAAEAGLRPGDRILSIDGRSVRYWTDREAAGGGLWSVTHNIAPYPGTALRIAIKRSGQQLERFVTPREDVCYDRLGLRWRCGLIGVSPLFEMAQIGVIDPASPAGRAGLHTGDLITAVNGRPIERWDELAEVLQRNRGDALRLAYLRPGASLSDFADLRLLQPQTTVVDPEPRHEATVVRYETGMASAELFVRRVDPGSPAATIGLRPGDQIVALDGRPARHWAIFAQALRQRPAADHRLVWLRRGGTRHEARFRFAKVTYRDDIGNNQARYIFGAEADVVARTHDPVPVEGRLTYAAVESVRYTSDLVQKLLVVIVELFRGGISRDTIGGPLMLAKAARVAAETGWDKFLLLMALISINLGIINLLPVPILDGGHIMFFTVEAIRRRPLSLRARAIASYIGLVLLVSLMVLAMKNDITRYWLR
ncbi:MAG: RIP metalloprotease RseP [Proteobacteria bacterium]|nr:RIP metalloprotease RseP [Pseudomonadota bacterium]